MAGIQDNPGSSSLHLSSHSSMGLSSWVLATTETNIFHWRCSSQNMGRQVAISLLGLPYRIAQTRQLKQQEFIFSQFWKPEVQDQSASRVGFLVWPLLWAYTWPPHWLSSVVYILDVSSSSCKDTSHTGLKSPFMTSFSLDYLLKGSISNYSHIGGQGFNIQILRGTLLFIPTYEQVISTV